MSEQQQFGQTTRGPQASGAIPEAQRIAKRVATGRTRPPRRLAPGQRWWVGYLFASPWFIGFFGLMLLPMIASLALSLVQWNGISLELADPDDPHEVRVNQIEWVGLRNYVGQLQEVQVIDEDGMVHTEMRRVGGAFQDDLFYKSLWNTAVFSFVAVPLGLFVALMLALLLNQKLAGINIFRTIFYMPHVVGGVATIMMWLFVFNPETGLLNALIRPCLDTLAWIGLIPEGVPAPGWIFDAFWAKPAVILMSLWGSGGAMLIFLAALQNVPEQLYEAARIDGAGKISQFWHVTMPQISPAIFFNLVMGVIYSFQVFNEAYIMTDGTGGTEKSLLFYVLNIFIEAFLNFRMGYASALAWILFAVIMVFTLVIVASQRYWVYYEGDTR